MANARTTLNGLEQTELSNKVQKLLADYEREHGLAPAASFFFMVAFVYGLGRRLGWDTGGMLGYATKAWESCDRALGRITAGMSVGERDAAEAQARGKRRIITP